MTKNTEARFQFNHEMDCQDAADILGAISYLLSEAAFSPSTDNPDYLGQLEMPYRSVHGLTLIMDSVAGGLEAMQNEADMPKTSTKHTHQPEINSERTNKIIKVIGEAVFSNQDKNTTSGDELDDQQSYPKVAELSARELAIRETYNKGYPVEEIAKAVNLKKTTVQRVIDTLKSNGTITGEPDKLSQAVHG